ncbi:hypothetical protein [Ruminiclostridium hungatei]|uniref:hypothetical protein n=1 Tax=Ruminiclostridium hungatei TaxID=48256 RepID=UPI001A995599|nr:hypothetical protein [Ruminiclostridium hungatei]
MSNYIYLDESSKMPEDIDIIWSTCPECGQKLCRLITGSKAHKIYLWCKHCKKEVEINI